MNQADNCLKEQRNEDGDSHRRQYGTPDGENSDLLREKRKEIDEMRNAIKRKMDQSLDRMVRKTNSSFTSAV